MKKVFFFTCSFIFFVSLQAQNWQSVGGGLPTTPQAFRSMHSDSNYLYAGLLTSFPYPHPLRKWNNILWDTLGSRCATTGEAVSSMVTYQNKLTVSRSCGIFQWDGITWQPLATDAVGYLHVLNDTLYATGGFDSIGGMPASCIAKYNGTTWNAIDTTKWYSGAIHCAVIYQGDLYIGGNVYNWNGTMYNMAKWNGTQWQPVGGNAMAGGMSWVSCFEIYNGDLYIGGSFYKSAGNPGNGIVRWDGTQWMDAGGGIGPSPSEVRDMKVFNGELYAAGNFSMAGGIPTQYIAKWDGINWCSLGDTISNTVNAIEVYITKPLCTESA